MFQGSHHWPRCLDWLQSWERPHSKKSCEILIFECLIIYADRPDQGVQVFILNKKGGFLMYSSSFLFVFYLTPIHPPIQHPAPTSYRHTHPPLTTTKALKSGHLLNRASDQYLSSSAPALAAAARVVFQQFNSRGCLHKIKKVNHIHNDNNGQGQLLICMPAATANYLSAAPKIKKGGCVWGRVGS